MKSSPREAENTVFILFPKGIHMRPAAKIVRLAKCFSAKITLSCEQRKAHAKSMTQLLLLEARRGSQVHIRAQGEDAKEAVASLSSFLQSRGTPPPSSF